VTTTDIFYEIFADLPRQGPGDNASTRRALAMAADLPAGPAILDIGCGVGMQTLELLRLTGGRLVALDNHRPYLAELRGRAIEQGLAGRLATLHGSMFDLPFVRPSFDLIWAEGSIFVIGFERGLTAWRPYLKRGGFLVISEISWLIPTPPEEPQQYWAEAEVTVNPIAENLACLERAGYQPVGYFILPPSAWWKPYYRPMEQNIARLKQKYKNDPAALELLDGIQAEIDLYRRYGTTYGYVFYVMQVG
jgi:SAM-dependent methyltransferase